jgi:hypothetical protein
MDLRINNLTPNSLKISAFLSISIGYLLIMIPENMYNYVKNRFWPETHEHIETYSLTRRYKQTTNN